MDDSISNLPTSRLLGSVPAVTGEDKKSTSYEVPEANLEIFPPGHQSSGSSRGQDGQATSRWNGVFSISSYTQYFNVNTDVVLERIKNSMYSLRGDFFGKIDDNPDLYGPVWISATLIFMLAALGNCATYLMDKQVDGSTTWTFNVNYINLAAFAIYGYLILVPTAFYFLLQYLGSNPSPSLIRFWCMWGYSLFVFVPSTVSIVLHKFIIFTLLIVSGACGDTLSSSFVPSTVLMVAPSEIFRWIIILLTASASSCFVALNLKSYIEGADLLVAIVSALVLQFALGIFMKVYFFS